MHLVLRKMLKDSSAWCC